MYFHQGVDFQRGRGFGSLFSGLFRSLVPIAKTGLNLGKRVLKSDFVRNLSSQALNAGKDMVKDIATDVIEGKNISESFADRLGTAKKRVGQAIIDSDSIGDNLDILKKKVGETIRGRGRKRKRISVSKNHKRMLQSFNLLE